MNRRRRLILHGLLAAAALLLAVYLSAASRQNPKLETDSREQWRALADALRQRGYPVGLTRRQTDWARHGVRERHPKVLVKMGHWHVYRGVGPSHLQTLGNFATEFAFANGRDALAVAVFLGGSGET